MAVQLLSLIFELSAWYAKASFWHHPFLIFWYQFFAVGFWGSQCFLFCSFSVLERQSAVMWNNRQADKLHSVLHHAPWSFVRFKPGVIHAVRGPQTPTSPVVTTITCPFLSGRIGRCMQCTTLYHRARECPCKPSSPQFEYWSNNRSRRFICVAPDAVHDAVTRATSTLTVPTSPVLETRPHTWFPCDSPDVRDPDFLPSPVWAPTTFQSSDGWLIYILQITCLDMTT